MLLLPQTFEGIYSGISDGKKLKLQARKSFRKWKSVSCSESYLLGWGYTDVMYHKPMFSYKIRNTDLKWRTEGDKLTWEISDSTIRHWCDMSVTKVTILLSAVRTKVGPNTMARLRASILFVVLCSTTFLRWRRRNFNVSKWWSGRSCNWENKTKVIS
jgi:hypothetical protein